MKELNTNYIGYLEIEKLKSFKKNNIDHELINVERNNINLISTIESLRNKVKILDN